MEKPATHIPEAKEKFLIRNLDSGENIKIEGDNI